MGWWKEDYHDNFIKALHGRQANWLCPVGNTFCLHKNIFCWFLFMIKIQSWDSVEHVWKWISQSKAHSDCTYQVWLAVCLQILTKSSTNQRPGHDKNDQAPDSPIVSSSTKFDINLINDLSGDTQKPWKWQTNGPKVKVIPMSHHQPPPPPPYPPTHNPLHTHTHTQPAPSPKPVGDYCSVVHVSKLFIPNVLMSTFSYI